MSHSDRIAELEAELARVRAERDALAKRLADAQVYQLAIAHAPVGVMCTSLTTGEYVFSNRAHAAFLGYTPEEIVAGDPHERWMEITHPEDFERELDLHQRLAQGEIGMFESERRCIRRNGEIRWARVTVVGVRDSEDRLAYIYVYFVDMHEQRAAIEARERLEAQLRRSQKLEALGRLAGGVAHDFNNRLLIIMGYAEALKKGLAADDLRVHQASMIVESARRAAELTRQLLAYSRRQVLKPQAFDVNESVESMRGLLERLIGDDIQLETNLSARRPVFSDPGQIEQVVLNLALNARDAMPSGGRLTLETADIEVGPELDQTLRPGNYVALVVKDSGTGIPEELLPRIFEPFFTTKSVGNGTGLGLATVEGIVQQSGGSIRVQSRVSEGTTFTIYLPSAEKLEVVTKPARSEPPVDSTRFETLLVCDDDAGVRELLVDILRVRSYRVLEARNGRHALEVARTHQGSIDLLITDLVMPEMSGMQLAAALRESMPGLLVLYVSGYTDDVAMVSGSLGADANFLAKPFMPGELVRAVNSMLMNARQGRSRTPAPSKHEPG